MSSLSDLTCTSASDSTTAADMVLEVGGRQTNTGSVRAPAALAVLKEEAAARMLQVDLVS